MTPNDVKIKCVCEMSEVCMIRAEVRTALFKWVERHGETISRLTIDWDCSMQRRPDMISQSVEPKDKLDPHAHRVHGKKE